MTDRLESQIARIVGSGQDFALVYSRTLFGGWQWEAFAHGVGAMLSRDQDTPRHHVKAPSAAEAVEALLAQMGAASCEMPETDK